MPRWQPGRSVSMSARALHTTPQVEQASASTQPLGTCSHGSCDVAEMASARLQDVGPLPGDESGAIDGSRQEDDTSESSLVMQDEPNLAKVPPVSPPLDEPVDSLALVLYTGASPAGASVVTCD